MRRCPFCRRGPPRPPPASNPRPRDTWRRIDVARRCHKRAAMFSSVLIAYRGERQEPAFLREKAYETGYPVLIKAVAGGGGKGMRQVDRHADFQSALESAMREAQSAFGDARVLIEKYVTAPRHVEMQVFAD